MKLGKKPAGSRNRPLFLEVKDRIGGPLFFVLNSGFFVVQNSTQLRELSLTGALADVVIRFNDGDTTITEVGLYRATITEVSSSLALGGLHLERVTIGTVKVVCWLTIADTNEVCWDFESNNITSKPSPLYP